MRQSLELTPAQMQRSALQARANALKCEIQGIAQKRRGMEEASRIRLNALAKIEAQLVMTDGDQRR